MTLTEFLDALPPAARVLAIALLALLAHLVVRVIRAASETIITGAASPADSRDVFILRRPKAATVASLVASAATFVIYFAAVGLLLWQVGLPLTGYFATATVIGLAVAFGSQGLVQDVVIGMTLLLSDAFDLGDVVETTGQIGRVEKLGLRFTSLVTLQGQTVYVPNRNIATFARFRGGFLRAVADVQVPESLPADVVAGLAASVAAGLRHQYPGIILADPAVDDPRRNADGGWEYVRVEFRLWPGQAALVEAGYRQRVAALVRGEGCDYPDWMVTVTLGGSAA
jgi:moderate conductance mechanosensitive channel